MNETLEHHGILGMKWGVRRYQNKDGTWTEEGKEHRNPSVKDCKKEYNELRKQRNAYYDKYGMDLPEKESKELDSIDERINSLIEGRYSEAVFREYNEKQPELIRNHTGEEVSWKDAFGDSYENTTKGNRHSLVGLVEGGTGQYRFKSRMLGHSDESEDDIASDDSSEDTLEHHGILGMKWGIRRYQNADGSLTAAGRKRYGVDENDGQRSSSGQSSGQSSGSNSDTTTRTPAKSASEMTDQELNQALNRLRMEQQYNELTGAKSSNQYQNQQNFSTPPSNTGNLSNAELQAYITRLDMEKRYAQLTAPPPKEISAGKKFMNDVVGPAINQVAKAYIVASLSKALGLKGDGDNGGNNNNNGGKKNNNNDDSQYKSIKKELNDLKSMMGSQRKQDNSGNQKRESSRDSESSSLPEPQHNTHRDSIFSAARDAARNAREQRREQQRQERAQKRENDRLYRDTFAEVRRNVRDYQRQEREERQRQSLIDDSRRARESQNRWASVSAFLSGLERQNGIQNTPAAQDYRTSGEKYLDSYIARMGR